MNRFLHRAVVLLIAVIVALGIFCTRGVSQSYNGGNNHLNELQNRDFFFGEDDCDGCANSMFD